MQSHGVLREPGEKVDPGHFIARGDPLRAGILLAAVSELAGSSFVHSSAGRRAGEIPVLRGVIAAGLLASVRRPAWRVPALANASLQHFLRAGRLGRTADVVWAAALGALLCEARRAERWEA
jgi:hypothetical protein